MAIVLLAWQTGWQLDGRLIIIGAFCLGMPGLMYVLSVFRNYGVLGESDLRVATWLAHPFKDTVIPYDVITEIIANDSTGELAVKFINPAGEREAADILLDKVSASSVKDEILSRQPFDLLPIVRPDLPAPVVSASDLPNGSEKKTFVVWHMPRWPWFLAAAAPAVGILALIVNGFDLTPVRIFGVTLFFESVVLAIFLFFGGLKRLELKGDKVIIGSAPYAIDRVPYRDITEVASYETGYLVVKYNKRATLGVGAGQEIAAVRLLHHPDAAVAAAVVRAAVERANQAR